jgi:hypothetical protein
VSDAAIEAVISMQAHDSGTLLLDALGKPSG